MANLSLPNIRERPGRAATLVDKLEKETPFEMVGGGTKILDTLIHLSGPDKMDLIVPSESPGQKNLALEILESKASSGRYLFLKKRGEKERFSLGHLLKSADFGGKGKGNRGDMAEAIFAAAIVARFMHKNTPVLPSQVIALIKEIDRNPSTRTQSKVYDSPNKNPKIMDKVTFELGLAKSNLEALTDDSVLKTLGNIVNAAIKYANSSIVTSKSKLLYTNNQYNDIKVIADGVGNQKGTKVDVRVKIDDKPTDMNVSLKADDVKQFGQIGGDSFEVQKELWDKLLGLNVDGYEREYYDEKKEKKGDAVDKAVRAIGKVYSGVTKMFNENKDKEALYKKLADGINYFATLGEENVTLVQLAKEEAQVYKFDKLQKSLKDVNLTAKFNTSKKYSEINFQDENDLTLITIRIKLENKQKFYLRNYIEKGKLLSNLTSSIAR